MSDPVSEQQPDPASRLTLGRGQGNGQGSGSGGLRSGLVAAVVAALLAGGIVASLLLVGRGDDEPQRTRPASERTPTAVPTPTGDVEPPPSLDVPTIDPSDFPTTGFPTLGTELPTPSGLPTRFVEPPSQFPTDPSGWASFFNEQREQLTRSPQPMGRMP